MLSLVYSFPIPELQVRISAAKLALSKLRHKPIIVKLQGFSSLL